MKGLVGRASVCVCAGVSVCVCGCESVCVCGCVEIIIIWERLGTEFTFFIDQS